MVDLNFGIEEIVEYSIIAALLLLIGGGIFLVSNTDHIKSKTTATQLFYVSTLISNNNMKAQITYPKTQIEEENFQIKATTGDVTYPKNYYGKKVSIQEINTHTYEITPENE
jgi:hypothetical protein